MKTAIKNGKIIKYTDKVLVQENHSLIIEKDIILHYHDLDTLIGGVFTSKIGELPLIYDCHENYPGLVKGAISSRGATFLHKIEAYLLNYCAGIMAAGPAGYIRLKEMLEKGSNAPFSANEDEAFKVLSKTQSEFLNSRITKVGNAKRLETYPLSRIEKRNRKEKYERDGNSKVDGKVH